MERKPTEFDYRGLNSDVVEDLNKRRVIVTVENMGFVPFVPFVSKKINKIPSFESEWLPQVLQKYVDAVSESLQVPKDMVGLSVITIISLAVQGKYAINPFPGWIEPLNLYSVVVARPSERKSPTMREVTSVVYDYVREENEKRLPDIESYNLEYEILSKQIKNMKESVSKGNKNSKVSISDIKEKQQELSELEEITPLRLIADDVTPEALISLMAKNNGRMAIVSAEGGIFDIIAGRYTNNANVDVYLKSYSGDQLSIDRKGRESEYIDNPLLTVLLMVQPSVIEDIMENKDMSGRGLLARFLYTLPNSMIGNRNYRVTPVHKDIKNTFNNLILSLLSMPDLGEPRILKLSKDADSMAEDYFKEIESNLQEELEEVEGWAGKLHGQTMRIAGILHCAEYIDGSYNHLVSENTMNNAIKLGRYFLEHAKAAFLIMGMSDTPVVKNAKYILKCLDKRDKRDKRDKSISKRDLFRLCDGRFKSVEEMQLGLDELVNHGYIRIYKNNTTGGRPTEIIEINPEYELQKVQKEGDYL